MKFKNQTYYKIQVLLKNIAFCIVSFIMVSCVNDRSNQRSSFDISINLEVSNDDKIQLFYIPFGDSIYRDRNLVTKKIKASDKPVIVMFSIPIIPEKFRIDLGEQKIESPIKINEIKITKNNKVINIEGNTVNRFFKPNVFLKETSQKNIFLRQTINNTYDPFMESTPLLHKKIELEIKR